jgi:hypothetical protein
MEPNERPGYTTTGGNLNFVPVKGENDEYIIGLSDKDRIRELEKKVDDLIRRVRDLEWQRT